MLDTAPRILLFIEMAFVADLKTWHERLGHVDTNGILKMALNEVVAGLSIAKSFKCASCASCSFGKLTQNEIPTSANAKNVDIRHYLQRYMWTP